MHPTQCPHCNTLWEEKETIFEYFLNKYKDETKARASAELYGCTVERPKHFSKDVVGIEIQGQYDGVSFWKCKKCNSVFDRWTMKSVDNY